MIVVVVVVVTANSQRRPLARARVPTASNGSST
jgi:hypothetical protein